MESEKTGAQILWRKKTRAKRKFFSAQGRSRRKGKTMEFRFETRKDLPSGQLMKLFSAVGWTDDRKTTAAMAENFNAPFLRSTLVVSAWEGATLIGCVRALSDGIIRSVIFDLAVLPEFQCRGIGKELIKRCREAFPDSQWLVETTAERAGYYEKLGFKREEGVFLSLPSKWF